MKVKEIVVESGRFTARANESLITVTVPDGPNSQGSSTVFLVPTDEATELLDLVSEAREALDRLNS